MHLTNESLDDLLVISTDSVPLKHFNPDDSIDLWWADKIRRPGQAARKEYKRKQTSSFESEESDANQDDLLEDWDDLIMDETSDNDTTESDLLIYLYVLPNSFSTKKSV